MTFINWGAASTGGLSSAAEVNQFLTYHSASFGYLPLSPSPTGNSTLAYNPTTNKAATGSGHTADGQDISASLTSLAVPFTISSTTAVAGVWINAWTKTSQEQDVWVGIVNSNGTQPAAGPGTVVASTVIPSNLLWPGTNTPTNTTPNPYNPMMVPLPCSLNAGTYFLVVSAGGYNTTGLFYQSSINFPMFNPNPTLNANQSWYYNTAGGAPNTVSGTGWTANSVLGTIGVNYNKVIPPWGLMVSSSSSVLPWLISEDSGLAWQSYTWTQPSNMSPEISKVLRVAQKSSGDLINYFGPCDAQFTDSSGAPNKGYWGVGSNNTNVTATAQNTAGVGNSLLLTRGGSSAVMTLGYNSAPLNLVNTSLSSSATYLYAVLIQPWNGAPARHVQLGVSTNGGSTYTTGTATVEASTSAFTLYTMTFTLTADAVHDSHVVSFLPEVIIGQGGDIPGSGEQHLIAGTGLFVASSIPAWSPSGLGIGSKRTISYSGSAISTVT